jgi:DNA-binding NarL/FixJ family response regulator
MKSLKIILVDDNNAFREALKMLLVNQYNAEIIGEASSAEEFWGIKSFIKADIIIMDVMMPGTDGIALTKKIHWDFKDLKILAITLHYDKVYLTSLIEAGFIGCVFKNNLYNEIGTALEAITVGKRFYPENIIIQPK